MRAKKLSVRLKAILTVLVVTLCVIEASAGKIKVLHEFGGKDGNQPNGVILDASGNLYGTTTYGGPTKYCVEVSTFGCGLVYELTPAEDGHWTEKILYVFDVGVNNDPGRPSAPFIFDSAGNLYSTYQVGQGTGGVFEMSPNASGGWDESIVYGLYWEIGLAPMARIVFDAAGNIYSTASGGGLSSGWGTVFELTPTGSGTWTDSTIMFLNGGGNGGVPLGSLTLDASGNVYGTAYASGPFAPHFEPAEGVVFELTPQGDGTWTTTILHAFARYFSGAGENPYDQTGLVFDAAGNLYGTTQNGGHLGFGTVFELSPTAGGTWDYKVLHSFRGNDGSGPTAGVVFDAAGNLYGETLSGGANNDGVVFKLTPTASGGWTQMVLHSFSGTDGIGPWQGLVFDAAGNLYGTAQAGGAYGDGTVFKITP